MKTKTLSHGHAWLLETIALWDPVSISFLGFSEQGVREQFNRGTHGLSHDGLMETLRELFDRGDLIAYRSDGSENQSGFNPTDDELDRALNDDDGVLLGFVSNSGGARWESLAGPDWDRYFVDRYPSEGTVQLTAGSRIRLLEIIRESKLLWNQTIEPQLPKIEVICPWSPFSWKTLPSGFRATATCREFYYAHDAPPGKLQGYYYLRSEEGRAEYAKVKSWAKSICGLPWI